VIERTVDGGRTWRVSWPPGCGCDGGQVNFYDARHGYALVTRTSGGTRLYWTGDGGATWRRVGRASIRFDEIVFADRRYGYAITPAGTGNTPPGAPPGTRSYIPPKLYRTTDGGKRWSRHAVPRIGLVGSVSVLGHHLVGVGWKRIYESVDGGAHWTALVPPGLSLRTTQVSSPTGSPGTAVYSAAGRLYVTHNYGRSWDTIVPRGLPAQHQGLVFSSPRVGWTLESRPTFAGFELAVYRSTDGGRHWTQYAVRPTRP
jgi:photosystem II stability/assembly factor-like uncharacterized protein